MKFQRAMGKEFVRCVDAKLSHRRRAESLNLVLRRYNGEITVHAERGIEKPFKASRFEDVDPGDLPPPQGAF